MQVIDGKTIRNRRRELNMTLEECCEGICSLSYLSMIENGKRPLTVELLEKFTVRLGLNELNAHSRFSLEAMFTSGLIAVRSGRVDDVRQILREMPDSAFKDTLRGLLHEKTGDLDASISYLRPILSKEVEPSLFLMVANSLVRQLFQAGELESAMEIGEFSLRKASALQRPLDDALIELRGTLASAYAYLGDSKRGLELTSSELETQQTSWSQVIENWSRASLQLKSGDMTGAAVSFRRAYDQMVEFDRPVARARLLRAAVLARLHSTENPGAQALGELEYALEVFASSNLEMDQIETKYAIALLHFRNGSPERAKAVAAELEQQLATSPTPKSLILKIDLADLLLAIADESNGLRLLNDAKTQLESATGSRLLALAWSRLGAVQEKLGNQKEAYEAIKRSVAIAGFAATPVTNFSLE